MYLVIVDSKESWGVTIGNFIVLVLALGYVKTYSLIIIEYRDLLDAPTSLLIFSLMILATSLGFLSPLSNILTNRFTTRKCMYICSITASLSMISTAYAYSTAILLISTIILAISVSTIYTPTLAISMKCHKKRQNISQGIIRAGGSFGSLFIPLILSQLIVIYSIRGFMLVMSGIYLHLAVAAALMPTHIIEIQDDYKPSLVAIENYKIESEKEFIKIGNWEISSKTFKNKSKLKWPPRKLWFSLILCCIGIGSALNGHMILVGLYGLYTRDLSINIRVSAYILIFQSILGFFAKIICGFLVDINFISRWTFLVSSSFALSVLTVSFGFFPTMPVFYIYLFGFGIFGAPIVTLATLLIKDIVGNEYLNTSLSVYFVSQGLMGLLIGYLIGYICDITNSPYYGIIVLGLIIGFGALILVIEYFSRKKMLSIVL